MESKIWNFQNNKVILKTPDRIKQSAPHMNEVPRSSAMDPSEVEFLAEKELVTIVPNFNLDKIYLIGVWKIQTTKF